MHARAKRRTRSTTVAFVLICAAVGGCRSKEAVSPSAGGAAPQFFQPTLSIDQPRLDMTPTVDEVHRFARPRTWNSPPPSEFQDLALAEALRSALLNGQVLRGLGGRVIDNPAGTPTLFDPAITESDPLYGSQGALSVFDPTFSSNVNWIQNDRALNNILQGGGVRNLQERQWNYQTGLRKTAGTGTQFSLLNNINYDASNATGNLFPSAWDTQIEAGVRQPLLQGAGVAFNRIAGPNAQPGFNFSNGVLLARIRTDLTLADFEAGVAQFTADVESAYWNLYVAYRNFEARQIARDAAYDAWQYVLAKRTQGLPGGEVDREADARERFLAAQDELEDALAGESGGGGLYAAERRLRRLMGLPQDDGRQLRPVDPPPEMAVRIAWEDVAATALAERVELRKQRWLVKQRELELIAAKNFTLPSLDAVGQYRFRGFGNDLTSSNRTLPFQSAYEDLTSLDHQEWQLGMELQMPLGFRRGWAAVRHAELQLSRERAVLVEQEAEVLNELGGAVAAVERGYAAIGNARERLGAAEELFDATQASFAAEKATMETWTDARRRLAEARVRYTAAQQDYAEALRRLYQSQGELLTHNGIQLAEGPWGSGAKGDARENVRRWRPVEIDYRMVAPETLSATP